MHLQSAKAAKAAQEWADANAVTFDTEKTEAIVLSRRRNIPLEMPVASELEGKQSNLTSRRLGG